ncbi:hypothetical protein M8998_07000 [Sphingobacterium sp. lm-10]|uniref:hypothetical protein n=1 Tax=Sphingobacterium sp. lm-10 TaxID=2944904 RepID=UPI002021FE13|nr:hypothetical protein [Sphingobacterium sp. lm-10]MCL7987681.1 hypothetical protein [Sphingobacterium sp. lm-10]
MKFYNYITIFALIVLSSSVILSCTKESYVDDRELSLEDSVLVKAKQWFNRGARSATSNSDINLLGLIPKWDSHKLRKNTYGQSIVSVPLGNKGNARAYLYQLVVVIDGQGQPHGIIKEFEKNPFIGNSPMKIYTGDGKLYMEGLYVLETKSLRVLDANKIPNLNISTASKKSSVERRTNGGYFPDDPDWQIDIDEIPIPPPTAPTPPPPPSPNPPGNGGGGGGCSGCGGGGAGGHYQPDPYAPVEPDYGENPNEPEPPEEHFEILDSLQGYPCAQNILNQLPNLKNQISEWLVNEFGGIENDLVFRAVTTLPDNVDGYWNTNNQIGTMQTITLNGNMLNTASKEYILVTMYHEALHAYIYLEKTRLSPELFFAKYSEWSEINLQGVPKYVTTHSQFRDLMTHLVSAIKAYNPNISDYDAEVLAKTGVVSSMSDLDINKNKSYKNGNSGTKCLN